MVHVPEPLSCVFPPQTGLGALSHCGAAVPAASVGGRGPAARPALCTGKSWRVSPAGLIREPQSEARSCRGLLQRAPTGGLPGAGLLAKPSGRLVWKREVVCAKPGPRGTGCGISARHRASPGLSSLGKERHTHRVVGRGKWGVMTRAQTVPGSCGIRLMWNPARRAPPSTTVSAGGLLAAPPGPREYLLHEKWQMSQIRPFL